MSSLPSTHDFYRGKSIFITGATGFLGRFLVYKILKEYDVSKIFILLRGKSKKDFQHRYDEYVNLELFRDFLPDTSCLSKIVALEGDICEDNCGLTDEQRQTLSDQVNIVIHSAATIRFTAPLKSSALIHVNGTHNVIELAASFNKLDMFVHVSSMSAWLNHDSVPEDVPECTFDPYEITRNLKCLFSSESKDIESEFIGQRPKFVNSYSVTKSFAELVVNRNKHRLKRVAIIRPPFLVCSNSEPATGWFDEPQETVSLAALGSFGMCRICNLELHQAIDVLPVDVCVNALLAVTWYMVVKENESALKVFNLSIINTGKCTVYDMLPMGIQLGYRYPSTRQLRPPIDLVHYPVTDTYVSIKSFFTHTLFSLLVDLILLTMGRKPMLFSFTRKKLSAISKIFQSLAKYKPVYKCETKNIDLIYGEQGALSAEDRQVLFYDLKKIDWYKIAENSHLNFRRRVLKEPDETLPFARRRLYYITRIYKLLTCAVQLAIAYFVYKINLIVWTHVPNVWPITLGFSLYYIYRGLIDVDDAAFVLQPSECQ